MGFFLRLPLLLLELLLRRGVRALTGRRDSEPDPFVVPPVDRQEAAMRNGSPGDGGGSAPAPVAAPASSASGPGSSSAPSSSASGPGPGRAPAPPPPAPPPPAPPAPMLPAPPPPTAEEAIERRFTREAVETVAPPVTTPTPSPPLGGDAPVDRDAELVESFGPEEDVAGTMVVAEPWPGYDAQPAREIVARVRDADSATKAVVALYERQRKARATVMRATTTKP